MVESKKGAYRFDPKKHMIHHNLEGNAKYELRYNIL